MIFDALEFTKQRPFKDVLIHGLVLDSQGRKMSKSLGNGVDPLDEIERYGADALRLTLVTGVTPGNDVRYRNEKVEASRNFTNKLWNAARFVLMNLDNDMPDVEKKAPKSTDAIDQWIITRFYKIAEKMTAELERYDFGEAAKTIKDFVWNEFCDWYVEATKLSFKNGDDKEKDRAVSVLLNVLEENLRLLHPFLPFVTEEIYSKLPLSEITENRKKAGDNFILSNSFSKLPLKSKLSSVKL